MEEFIVAACIVVIAFLAFLDVFAFMAVLAPDFIVAAALVAFIAFVVFFDAVAFVVFIFAATLRTLAPILRSQLNPNGFKVCC